VISRAVVYHGTTQGALAITGVPNFKHAFEPLVPGTIRVPNTDFYRAPDHLSADEKAFGLWAANRVEEAILAEGADSVAAVFVEPVQNAGGSIPPPPGYFERLREICDSYDVLLVSDEVICAYGRLGTMFGCEKFGYQPDIITSAKGLTSGYAALGAAIISDRIFEPFSKGTTSFCTATRSAGTQSPRAAALPISTSSKKRTCWATCEATKTPSAPPLKSRPAIGRQRAGRRLLLVHRAGQGPDDQGAVHQRRL
jgi:adenosylmethionine-8-amino-7-oxononanoate aminotransferase